MKKVITLFVVLVMFLSITATAFAQEAGDEVDDTGQNFLNDGSDSASDQESDAGDEEASDDGAEDVEVVVEDEAADEEEVEGAGITPDSFLWGLERVIERIDLLLTFDKSKKAKKGLKHAKERLLEVQSMVAKNKLKEAAKAQEAHDDTLEEVQEDIAEMGNGGDEAELENELELEKSLEEHRTLVLKVGKSHLKTKDLTTEQEQFAEGLFSSLLESTDKIEVEIKAKKDKTKIKIKAKSGITDEEIEALEASIKEKFGEDTEVKIKTDKEDDAEDDEEDEADDEEEDDDREIEVDIEKGKAKIEVKLGKEKLKFELDTTDLDAIVDEISSRTGLSQEEINDIIEIEEEEEEIEVEIEEEADDDDSAVEDDDEEADDDDSAVEDDDEEADDDDSSDDESITVVEG